MTTVSSFMSMRATVDPVVASPRVSRVLIAASIGFVARRSETEQLGGAAEELEVTGDGRATGPHRVDAHVRRARVSPPVDLTHEAVGIRAVELHPAFHPDRRRVAIGIACRGADDVEGALQVVAGPHLRDPSVGKAPDAP